VAVEPFRRSVQKLVVEVLTTRVFSSCQRTWPILQPWQLGQSARAAVRGRAIC
jgi:hypothetical protein